jgi:ligand-binding sensor domain-containing protein
MPTALLGQTIFQNIKWQDGLSAKQVRCLYKDQAGFLWIGTNNGLNRYDGAVVKQYKNGEKQKNLLVNAIQPLGAGDTLMLGLLNGVMLFDIKTGSFSKDGRFAALENQTVVTIKPDNLGRIWIGTANKVFVFEKGKLHTLSAVIPAAQTFGGGAYSLTGMVWDTTRNGFWIAGSKPYFIDIQKKAIYDKENNPFKWPIFDLTSVNAIAVDQNANVWYGCDKDVTLNFWDAKTGKVQRHYELDGKKISDGVNHLFIDQKDRLWISTWLFAAFIKERGKPIKKIEYDQNLSYCIGYGHFRDAISDKEGNVWLGTINGVSKSQSQYPLQAIYQLPNFKFFLETGFAHANSITVDKHLIMACKEDGIVAYHTDNRTYKRYIVTNGDLHKNRFVMCTKGKDAWWFAGNDGVYFLPDGGDKLVQFDKVKPNMPTRYANFIFADHKGNIWFQILDDAIYRFDPVTKKTSRYDGTDRTAGLFTFDNSTSTLQLKNKDILFSLPGSGLLRFDYQKERFSVLPEKELANVQVSKLVEDKKGEIWAAVSGKGLIKINRAGMPLDSIDSRNGLFYDYLSSIAIDSRGAVWGSSREGLMFFNPDTRAVTKVEIDLGKTLQDYYNDLTFANGKIYAVMLDHILVIDPFSFARTPVKKPPYITSVSVFGKEKLSLVEDNVLELAPNEDFITLQYASLSHRDIPSLQYSYQLEGIDKNWVNAGRSITTSYTNLLPGTYLFKVRSTNEFGRWMTNIRQLKIIVKPNLWQTWWFILACVIAGSTAGIFLYIAYRQSQQKELMLLRISKMLAESQLMALRAQMNPHFIFNCLNSIQECIVTEKYAEASKYLNKFSKLFRTVLHNSGKDLITVDQERQVLQLYLELELMRFEGSFSYEIIMDPLLEEDQIALPSMLLQPYVENALWHGLLHKDRDRKLVIEFKLIDEEIFLCRIEDNGIGREKSFELKANSARYKQHDSQGLRITKDRIDLLNKQGNHANLTITDLYDDHGNASGTRIEIELSTYLNNA